MDSSIWFPEKTFGFIPSNFEEFNNSILMIFMINLKKKKIHSNNEDIKQIIKLSKSKTNIINIDIIKLFIENIELLELYKEIKNEMIKMILDKYNREKIYKFVSLSPLKLINFLSKNKDISLNFQKQKQEKKQKENKVNILDKKTKKEIKEPIKLQSKNSFSKEICSLSSIQLYEKLGNFEDIFIFEKIQSFKELFSQIDSFLSDLFILEPEEEVINLYSKLISFSKKGSIENQTLVVLFAKIQKLLEHHKKYCLHIKDSIKLFFSPYSKLCNGNCKKYKPFIKNDIEQILSNFFDGNCCYFFGHLSHLSNEKEYLQVIPFGFTYNEEDLQHKKDGHKTTYKMLHRLNLTYSILIEYFQNPIFEKEDYISYKNLLKLLRVFTQIQFNIKFLMNQETTEGTYIIYNLSQESLESFNNIIVILYIIGGLNFITKYKSLIELIGYTSNEDLISSFFKDIELISHNIYNPGCLHNHITFLQNNDCSENDKKFLLSIQELFFNYTIDSKKEEFIEILKKLSK